MKNGAAALLASLALAACGGGGGGGGGGGSPNPSPPPSSDPGSFTLSATSLSFEMYEGRSAPADKFVTLEVTNATGVAIVGLAYVSPNQPAPWLTAFATGAGTSHEIQFGVSQGSLAPGSYEAVITAGTANAAGTVLKTRNITVTFVIHDVTVEGPTSLRSEQVFLGHSDVLRTQDESVSAPAGTSWKITSDVDWLRAPDTTFTGSATVPVVVDATGLANGSYVGMVRYASTANAEDYTEQEVRLYVPPPGLAVSNGQIVLGGADGTLTPETSLDVALTTGTNAWPITVEVLTDDGQPWLDVDAPANAVGEAGMALTVRGSRAAVPTGVYTGTVTVTANVAGYVLSQTREVVFNHETHKLVSSALGVGFSQFPSRSVLTRELRIGSSLDRTDIPWIAQTPVPWLDVTPAGMTGGALTITADPTGLATDQLHSAEVTVSSGHPLNDNEQVIRVSLWIGSVDPTDSWVATEGVFLEASPVDPRAYHANLQRQIEVFDVYSGTLVDTIDVPFDAPNEISGLAVSDDGTMLYVSDTMEGRIVELDAHTGALQREFTGLPTNFARLFYVRPDAHEMLILGTTQVLDLATGALMPETLMSSGVYSGASFDVDERQRILFVQNTGNSPSAVARYRIGYSSLRANRWYAEKTHEASGGSNGQDLCVSADQQRVYTANGHPYEFTVFDAATLSVLGPPLPGTAYVQSAECSWTNLFAGGAMVSALEPYNAWYYDAAGAPVDQQLLRGAGHSVARDAVRFSPDATRVITVTGGPSFSLNFTNAP